MEGEQIIPDNYDQQINFDLSEGKEIEKKVKNILDIEDGMRIAAITPRKAYTVKGEDYNDNTE